MPRRARIPLVGLWVLLLIAGPAHAQPPVPARDPGPVDRFKSEPFLPGGQGKAGEHPQASENSRAGSGPSISRIAGSLVLVAGLIVGLGLVYRRLFANQTRSGGAVTVISRQMLTPKHQVFILRLGHRLLVVGDSGNGMQPLTEVSDPAEVSAIVGEATNVSLHADAFAATLDHVNSQYDEDEGEEGSGGPSEGGGLGMAQAEVQSLLAKVRHLAGQQQTSERSSA